jgi:branched-chain amino acid transport system ATP-binding protein
VSAPLVEMRDVEAGYEGSRAIFGMSFKVLPGEAVSLLGRNGMGKTTTLNAMFGLLPMTSGRLFVKGLDMTGAAPHRIALAGLGYVPEGRQIFPRLTAEENLIATARGGNASRWPLGAIYAIFPALAERRHVLGTQLSGGEQQMLAIGRALMTNPELIVFDEATEGLAPLIRREIWTAIAALKKEGLAVLVVDRDLNALMKVVGRHIVLEKGEIVWTGTSTEVAADKSRIEAYLSV